MKKIVTLSFMLLFSGFLFAQLPFNFGIKAGVTTSKLTTDIGETQSAILNFQGGAFARINVKKFYIQPEIYFTKKGGEIKDSIEFNGGVKGVKKINLNTIDVPLLIGYKLFDAKLVNLRVMAGPVMSFVIKKDPKITYDGHNVDLANDFYKKDNFENQTWALQAGAGMDVLMFSLDIRYEWGLNDIYKPSQADFKNNIFLVSLGWKIF
jgi:hypothetical protein